MTDTDTHDPTLARVQAAVDAFADDNAQFENATEQAFDELDTQLNEASAELDGAAADMYAAAEEANTEIDEALQEALTESRG